MKRAVIAGLLVLCLVSTVLAGTYDIPHRLIYGGGVKVSGATYALHGTLGQALTGLTSSATVPDLTPPAVPGSSPVQWGTLLWSSTLQGSPLKRTLGTQSWL